MSSLYHGVHCCVSWLGVYIKLEGHCQPALRALPFRQFNPPGPTPPLAFWQRLPVLRCSHVVDGVSSPLLNIAEWYSLCKLLRSKNTFVVRDIWQNSCSKFLIPYVCIWWNRQKPISQTNPGCRTYIELLPRLRRRTICAWENNGLSGSMEEQTRAWTPNYV